MALFRNDPGDISNRDRSDYGLGGVGGDGSSGSGGGSISAIDSARRAVEGAVNSRDRQAAQQRLNSLMSLQRNPSNLARGQIAEKQTIDQAAAGETGGKIGKVLGGIALPGIGGPLGKLAGTEIGKLASGPVTGIAGVTGPDGKPIGGSIQGGRGGLVQGGRGNVRDSDRVGGQYYGSGGGGGNSVGGGIGGIVDAQTQAQQQAIEGQRNQLGTTMGQLQPWQTAGSEALSRQRALLGMGTPDEQQAAFAAFGESPGQKFLRDRQEKTLMRNSQAMGGLGGGNVRAALQEQAAGNAAQDYSNYYNRLGGLSNQGYNATTAGGNFGAGTEANVSNLITGQGEARASGILAKEQKDAARTEGIANILGYFSDDIGDIIGDVGSGIGDAISSYWE